MSFPLLQPPPPPPPLPPQQTITVYPNPIVTTHPPYTQSSSPHHSSGSFGTAFLLLAIVIAVSAIACCLGRLCNRGRDRRPDDHPGTKKPGREDFEGGHGGNDVEFGFRRRDRGPSKTLDGNGNGSRAELGSVAKGNETDGAKLAGDGGVEPRGLPA